MGRPEEPQPPPVVDIVEEKMPYELMRDKRVSELAQTMRPLEEAAQAL